MVSNADSGLSANGKLYYTRWNDFVRWIGNNSAAQPHTIISNFPVVIYSENEQFTKINLSDYAKDLYDIWLDMRSRSGTLHTDSDKPPFATITEILSFDIDENGKSEFYIFGCILGVASIRETNSDVYVPNMYSFLYRISNGTADQIAFHSLGAKIGEQKSGEYNFRQKAGEGFFLMDKFGRMKIYNADSEIVAENIPVDENFCHIEIKSLSENTSRDNIIINYEVFTPDGNTETKRNKISDVVGKYDGFSAQIPAMEGFYLKDKNEYLTPFYFKPVLKKIDGGYLFGNYGGDLYLKLNENVQKIDDGLKNFRLEELKIIKKSKVG